MSKLVNIIIDGKKIQAPEGANLLQVAKDNGINIPSLCYHRKLSPTGACRLCVVKIKGTNGLVMSCTVSVKDGLEIVAFDSELEETRKHTLDYLLAEHNDNYDGTYTDEFKYWVEHYGLDNVKENTRIFLLSWVIRKMTVRRY